MKKIYVLFILLLVLIIPNKALAISSLGDYSIQNYNIDIIVNENNTLNITEKITAYFYTPKHGIFRKIPLRNTVVRNDGTTSKNNARISNINVSEQYSAYKEDGNEVIKIGSSSQTYTGAHHYTIKYTYDLGRDKLKKADELYYNLIGTEWDAEISNVTFKITMPKSFDKSLLGFSSGHKGSTNSSNVNYSVDGNIISGMLSDTLYAGEGLTVRLTLPEGYFVGANTNADIYSIAVILFSLVCVLIGYILWSKYGKDDVVVETVEFYPPVGYNSAEISFLYEGNADTQGIISLLVYLADKGYLKIEETDEKGLFSKSKGFRITKLKEYDGNNESERLFFKGLFKKRRSVDFSKVRQIIKEAKENGEKIKYTEAVELATDTTDNVSVTATDLYDNFYITLGQISRKINSKENKNKIFEESANKKKKWIILMIFALVILCTIKPILEYGNIEMVPILLFPIIGFSTLIVMVFGKTQASVKVFGVVWGVLFGGLPWAMAVLPAIADNGMYLTTHIIGIICACVLGVFCRIMSKRTPLGNEMLGKIRGFKRFLETAEKAQLESLVEQNPQYFYNILPYTYALGVSNKWMKQFETIAMQAPNWYVSSDPFTMHSFEHFMDSTMKSATISMSSSPSSDSGGGSSGGGSSGGGSGGGGGGSW